MMGTEMFPKTFVSFNPLTQPIAQGDFLNFVCSIHKLPYFQNSDINLTNVGVLVLSLPSADPSLTTVTVSYLLTFHTELNEMSA